jgi:hypothetical protein
VSQRSAHDRRQRRLLVGVGLMFFAPLGLAFFLYYGHGTWHPGAHVNAGELIQPARPLPPLTLPLLESGNTHADFLKRKWTLLYLATGPCAEDCRRHLYDTRQVRLALDRNMARVQRVFIAGGGCCDAKFLHVEHPDLITVRLDSASAPLLALLPGGDAAVNAQRIYLIDPLGNLMMWYAADASPKGMLEDLQRLLRLSSIG